MLVAVAVGIVLARRFPAVEARIAALGPWVVALPTLVCAGPLLAWWGVPWSSGAPMGADADVTYLATVAIRTATPALYEADRYPLFPLVVAALSPRVADIPTVGALVSVGSCFAGATAASWVGWRLGGPAAAVWAGLWVLRTPALIDQGWSFTPYPLIFCLHSVLLACGVELARRDPVIGHRDALRRMAAPLAIGATCCAALTLSDPKQLVVAVGGSAVMAALAVLAPVPLVWRPLGLVALLAVPAANTAWSTSDMEVYTVEHIVTRVRLDFEVSPRVAARQESGFRLGGDLAELPRTIAALTWGLTPPAGQGALCARAAASLPYALPKTTAWWALSVIALVVRLGWGRPTRLLALLPVALLAVAAWPTLHLHYQTRYLLPALALLPVLVAGLPSQLAIGLATLVWLRASTYSFGGAYRVTLPTTAEPWMPPPPRGGQELLWAQNRRWMDENLPPDALVVDYSASRPWTEAAGVRAYRRCNRRELDCGALLGAHAGPRYAIVWENEELGGRLWRGEGSSGVGERRGRCWTRVRPSMEPTALYAYGCE